MSTPDGKERSKMTSTGAEFRKKIVEAMQKLEFVTGLKQMREYTTEQMTELADALTECALEFKWLTPGNLEYILKHGMRGKYGEFYHLNVKTLSSWIKAYQKDNEQRINQSILKKDEKKVYTPEEIEEGLEIGRQIFRDRFEEAKKGNIAPLFQWVPSNYRKFIEKGLLVEEKYKVDTKEIEKKSRIMKGYIDDVMVNSDVKEKIWRMFIQDMIKKNIDLTRYL